MKISVIAISLLTTACTFNGVYSNPIPGGTGSDDGSDSGSGDGGDTGSGSAYPNLYTLTVDHSVAAEHTLYGVDSDGQGNLWVVYSAPGTPYPTVSVVHWNPLSDAHLATFTYADIFSPVSGIAVVGSELWLSYRDVSEGDAVTRVIDSTDGSIVRTMGITAGDLAAMGTDRVLVSPSDGDGEVLVAQTSDGGIVQTFGTTVWGGTQQGVAWRPGEIWTSGWASPMMILDESDTVLGTIIVPDLDTGEADPMRYLAFDNNELLVGKNGQLTWYSISK
ncbi:MAG TPA: hypothetical protein VGG28_27545 [Kofleriaceae bacterium]|jgi:hypothetical protein